jgi:phage-related protein
MSFTQDVQQLEPGNLVQLIEIDGTAFEWKLCYDFMPLIFQIITGMPLR